METTPRDVWEWFTSDAWGKLQVILKAPFDTPLAYWAHVLLAGVVWFAIAAAIVIPVFLELHERWIYREKR